MDTLILFILGFILLIKSADWLVTGSSSLAKRMGVSSLIIGLTIVAFGTSAPELIVNLLASLQGNTDIAIGNVIGSNIANILLILGISALIYPLAVHKGTVWREIPFALLAVLVTGLLANDIFFDGAKNSVLTRIDGLVLISFFAIFLYYIFSVAQSETAGSDDITLLPTSTSLGMVLGGLAGLVVGGKWIIDGAVSFATTLGVSEALIGLTIVAIGTSLPELATSAVAAYKRNVDIAVGNVIGSNIFNIFWILGVSATINPLPFSPQLGFDIWVVIGTTILLFLTLFVGRKHVIERWQGGAFTALYIAYLLYLIVRG